VTALPIIGRHDVLLAVSTALTDPSCRGVALLGAAGVGKTRIGEECLAMGADAGFATARVSGTQAASTIPFGALATLLPPVGEAGDRAELLRRAAAVVAALGGDRSLLLFVDDAHLLDDASATLVLQMATSGAAFVVATVRSGQGCPDPVVALWKDGLATRLDIEGLAEAEHHRFVDAVVGGQVDAASRQRLFHGSGGNPLLTRELVLAAREAGALLNEGGVWRLAGSIAGSSRLAELVGARIGALDDDEQKGLELVALGEPLELDVLDHLGLGEVVERLERRDLLRVTLHGDRQRVSTAHPLYGDVARARIPALRARNRRRALAEAVEASGGGRPEDVLRIATWRLDAGLTADADLMLTAARQARAAFDVRLAERLARAACDAGAGAAAAHVLGDALYQQNRGAEAEAVLAIGAKQAADDGTLALLTMVRADNRFWSLEDPDSALALAEEVRSSLTESLWVDVLTVVAAGYRIMLSERPVDVADDLVPLTTHEVPQVAATAEVLRGAILILLGRYGEAMTALRRAAALHATFDASTVLFMPSLPVALEALALTESGRIADAEALVLPAYRAAVESGDDRSRALLATVLARLRVRQGDVSEAAEVAREAVPLFRVAGQNALARLAAAAMVEAAAMSGDAVELEEATARLAEVSGGPARVHAGELLRASAAAAIATGARGRGLKLLRDAVASAAASGERGVELLALHALARAGEPAAVAERLAELAPAFEGESAGLIAAHAAAGAAGDHAALLDVAGRFEAIGALPWAADAALAAEVAAAAAGEVRAAVAARRKAALLVGRCPGHAPLSAGGEATDGTGPTTMLSEREREIAELAAAGRSDREIADALYLSVRTVSNHLQRAYGKLGVRSRAELRGALDSLV